MTQTDFTLSQLERRIIEVTDQTFAKQVLGRIETTEPGGSFIETRPNSAHLGLTLKIILPCARSFYHGSTLGVLGLTAYSTLENPFRPITKAHSKIPSPSCYRCRYGLSRSSCGLACAWELERVIQELGAENVAAFVLMNLSQSRQPLRSVSAISISTKFVCVQSVFHQSTVVTRLAKPGCGVARDKAPNDQITPLLFHGASDLRFLQIGGILHRRHQVRNEPLAKIRNR